MPASTDILQAIAERRIRREGTGINAQFRLDDHTVVNGTLLRVLHRKELIHLPMAGDPTLTDIGIHALQNSAE